MTPSGRRTLAIGLAVAVGAGAAAVVLATTGGDAEPASARGAAPRELPAPRVLPPAKVEPPRIVPATAPPEPDPATKPADAKPAPQDGQPTGLIGAPGPSVSHGRVIVKGDLDPAIVRRHVRRHAPRLHYCYARRQATVPTLAGTTRIEFRIAPTGKVESAKASGLDAEVDACIADAIRSIQFPRRKAGADVQYPITFKPA